MSRSSRSKKSTGTARRRRKSASRVSQGKNEILLDLASTARTSPTSITVASSSCTRPNMTSFVFGWARPRKNRALRLSSWYFASASIACMICHGRITTPPAARARVTSGTTCRSVTEQSFASAYSRALLTSAASSGWPSISTTRVRGSMANSVTDADAQLLDATRTKLRATAHATGTSTRGERVRRARRDRRARTSGKSPGFPPDPGPRTGWSARSSACRPPRGRRCPSSTLRRGRRA
jgi:hypothetical protein